MLARRNYYGRGVCMATQWLPDAEFLRRMLVVQPDSGHKLSKGVESYEDDNYIASVEALNNVLQTKLADKDDKVSAYKYIAFIHCVSGREKMCYESFRRALLLNPSFDLTPAEAGHPVWPVFRSAKAKIAK